MVRAKHRLLGQLQAPFKLHSLDSDRLHPLALRIFTCLFILLFVFYILLPCVLKCVFFHQIQQEVLTPIFIKNILVKYSSRFHI